MLSQVLPSNLDRMQLACNLQVSGDIAILEINAISGHFCCAQAYVSFAPGDVGTAAAATGGKVDGAQTV